MVKRGPTHVIDTLAIRTVLSQIPADWLVRNLEERDYGVDLTIEIFDGEHPTGQIALVQVKGRSDGFESPIKLSFPTKTIEYSLLFSEPFFVFNTSISDRRTHFAWIQKYAATKLKIDSPNWRDQDSVILNLPAENALDTIGIRKIKGIMEAYVARAEGLEFLAAYEWLKEHWESFKLGETGLLPSCLNRLNRIRACKQFLSIHSTDDSKNALINLRDLLESLRGVVENKVHREMLEEWVQAADNEMAFIDLLKKSFLDKDDIDSFTVEHSDTCPY